MRKVMESPSRPDASMLDNNAKGTSCFLLFGILYIPTSILILNDSCTWFHMFICITAMHVYNWRATL